MRKEIEVDFIRMERQRLFMTMGGDAEEEKALAAASKKHTQALALKAKTGFTTSYVSAMKLQRLLDAAEKLLTTGQLGERSRPTAQCQTARARALPPGCRAGRLAAALS